MHKCYFKPREDEEITILELENHPSFISTEDWGTKIVDLLRKDDCKIVNWCFGVFAIVWSVDRKEFNGLIFKLIKREWERQL